MTITDRMTAGDSIVPHDSVVIPNEDRVLMKRLTIVLAFVFAFTAAFTLLDRIYSHKFFDVTGTAKWIWAQHRISDNKPVAFFAAREFDLPANRYFTHLKILGDPEYTLYLNGKEIAGRLVGEERRIDVYDISPLVKTGRNRLVVAVRATHGVGGLIAAIDISPEIENWVVTDSSWKIHRSWDPALLTRDLPGAQSPVVLGAPPLGKWDYLTPATAPLTTAPGLVLRPNEELALKAYLPVIRTVGGVAVASAEKVRARAFDFGFTQGRVRLTIEGDSPFSRDIEVRFTNTKEELSLLDWGVRSFVFAPGEKSVETPETHHFRYVLVYGQGVRAEVVR